MSPLFFRGNNCFNVCKPLKTPAALFAERLILSSSTLSVYPSLPSSETGFL